MIDYLHFSPARPEEPTRYLLSLAFCCLAKRWPLFLPRASLISRSNRTPSFLIISYPLRACGVDGEKLGAKAAKVACSHSALFRPMRSHSIHFTSLHSFSIRSNPIQFRSALATIVTGRLTQLTAVECLNENDGQLNSKVLSGQKWMNFAIFQPAHS